eukprot:5146892-Amphidinium_carterae.1
MARTFHTHVLGRDQAPRIFLQTFRHNFEHPGMSDSGRLRLFSDALDENANSTSISVWEQMASFRTSPNNDYDS